MREAPSAYIFESDGTVHRQRTFDDEPLPNGAAETDRAALPL
jgi:hypothetical protein